MNASYPLWRVRGKVALDKSRRPKPVKPPPPTRAELCERLRVDLQAQVGLTAASRHRLLLLIDTIAAAKK